MDGLLDCVTTTDKVDSVASPQAIRWWQVTLNNCSIHHCLIRFSIQESVEICEEDKHRKHDAARRVEKESSTIQGEIDQPKLERQISKV